MQQNHATLQFPVTPSIDPESIYMKPAVFIASSAESIPVAHALQEELECVAESTVWSQGVFDLSKYSLESLIDVLDAADFGLFVFAPDDVLNIRGTEKITVRDNVVFELGLFIGRLGRERNFIVLPQSAHTDFHLPTDLMGITPGLYDANRRDKNMRAALGPVSTKISKAITRLGCRSTANESTESQVDVSVVNYSSGDKRAILESWMGNRPATLNTKLIAFADVDNELRLPLGTTKMLIKQVASQWNYVVQAEGEHTILFREHQAPIISRSSLHDDY